MAKRHDRTSVEIWVSRGNGSTWITVERWTEGEPTGAYHIHSPTEDQIKHIQKVYDPIMHKNVSLNGFCSTRAMYIQFRMDHTKREN
jgi:hypothetical protein